VNVIFVCYRRPQVFENYQCFRRFISHLYIVVLTYILVTTHEPTGYLDFSVFISRTLSSLKSYNASVSSFTIFMFSSSRLSSQWTDHKLICNIQYQTPYDFIGPF